MDTQRLILFLVFSLSIFILWEAWQRDQHPSPQTTQITTQGPANTGVPTPANIALPTNQSVTTTSAQLVNGERIKVKTDVIDAEIDTNGGDLRRLSLVQHGANENKQAPFVMFSDTAPHFYVAQTGLIGEGLPTHKALFSAPAKEYALAPNAQTLDVRLTWKSANGILVDKIYTFHRGSYLVDISYEIKNGSATSIQPEAYFQLLRDETAPQGETKFLPTYTGPATYTDKNKFQKHDFSKIGNDKEKDSITAKDGWVAMLQHYFIAAYLPQGAVQREFYLKKISDNLFTAGVLLPIPTIAPNARARIDMPLYAGPLEQETLKKLAPGLDLAVDYGWLTVIAVPIFWLLSFLHKWLGNWGWAIILLTVLIKLAFYPLSAASYRSMAKMKALAPRLQRMKEQFGDDRQKLHQAMMEIYKTEKINPLGGCLPVVIQIPVFIALYWVLLYSVEMRHAPFALWIHDLTAQDPYYILPVLMGISMVVQTRLNPTPPDPIQAKVMMIMPIAFSVMFLWFPSGLVLYWVVNNSLSIAQQWRINQVLKHAPKQAKR
jgi:YidC/Oxa1 family membrane protein insertase